MIFCNLIREIYLIYHTLNIVTLIKILEFVKFYLTLPFILYTPSYYYWFIEEPIHPLKNMVSDFTQEPNFSLPYSIQNL